MLSDREREVLCEIEYRLLQDPQLARCFGQTDQSRPAAQHHRIGDVATVVVALALRVTFVVGPRPPAEAELVTRATAGPRWIAVQTCDDDHRTGETPSREQWLDHRDAPAPTATREPQEHRHEPHRYRLPTPGHCAAHPRARHLVDTRAQEPH